MRTLSPTPHPFFFFFPKKSFVSFKVQTEFFFGTEVKKFAKKQDQGKKKPPKNRKELYQKDIKGKREGRGGGQNAQKTSLFRGQGRSPMRPMRHAPGYVIGVQYPVATPLQAGAPTSTLRQPLHVPPFIELCWPCLPRQAYCV